MSTEFRIKVSVLKEQNEKLGSFTAAANGKGKITKVESMSDGKFVKINAPGFSAVGDNFIMNSTHAAALLFESGMVAALDKNGKSVSEKSKSEKKATFKELLEDDRVTEFKFQLLDGLNVELQANEKGQNIKAVVLGGVTAKVIKYNVPAPAVTAENYAKANELRIEFEKETTLTTEFKTAPEQINIKDDNVQLEINAEFGRKGELAVFKFLKTLYSEKYNSPIIETSTGFKIMDKVEVFWKNITQESNANHDFKIIESEKEIYIDSKATGANDKLPLYISQDELTLMENAEKYLIARVYNALSDNPIIKFVKLEPHNLYEK